MSTLRVRLRQLGACRVEHVESGAVLDTDLPPEFGGAGTAFSATDLLAAALGTCIATSIDTVAVRHGIPLEAITVHVDKTLGTEPKRIQELRVTIAVAVVLDPAIALRLERAAAACTVHHSLHPDVAVPVTVVSGAAAAGMA